jgi:TonB-dependent Receptor Plug Domain
MHFKFVNAVPGMLFLLYLLLINAPLPATAQRGNGVLKGYIYDASTGNKILKAVVTVNNKSIQVHADGYYFVSLPAGKHKVSYSAESFQKQVVREIVIFPGEITSYNIPLLPVSMAMSYNSKKIFLADSVKPSDSSKMLRAGEAFTNVRLHSYFLKNGTEQYLSGTDINPSIDRDASLLVRRLGNISVFDNYANPQLQELTINGMGSRYNQLLFNNQPLGSFSTSAKQFPLSAIPVEALEEVSLVTSPVAALPADYIGGTLSVKVRDIPERNFFYVLGGGGAFNNLSSKQFLLDQKNNAQTAGFGGSIRNLPSDFPTIRSRTLLHEMNVQEQVRWMQQMNNNLAPVAQTTTIPNNRIVLGFGRMLKIKKNQLSIIAYVQQQKQQRADYNEVQAVPNTLANSYPFTNAALPVARAASKDSSFRYASQLSVFLNITFRKERSTFYFRNFFISQFYNSFTKRTQVLKPDEDTLSRFGLHYLTEQRTGINTQLAGEHLLGERNKLRFEWQAAYMYNKLTEPDERSILLTQDPSGKDQYQMAQANTASRTNNFLNLLNNGRSWRGTTDHQFTASAGFSMPFNLLGYTQELKSGFFLQSVNREFYNDLFRITQNNTQNYYTLNQLLAPERYFPEGVMVENFFRKINERTALATASDPTATNPNIIRPNSFGNYMGSFSSGAAYIQLQNQLLKNLNITWGARGESAGTQVTNIEYLYSENFKFPEKYPFVLKPVITTFSLLPFANITYNPFSSLHIHAAYAKTLMRPQMRELANLFTHQPLSFILQNGNPILESSPVHHYHAGIKWVSAKNTSISFQAFYRTITSPIEQRLLSYGTGYLTAQPFNTPSASVTGFNANINLNLYSLFKHPFFQYISFFANGNFLRSVASEGYIRANLSLPVVVPERELTETPPYTVNGGITIAHPRWPNLSVLYQETGDYLQMIGSGSRMVLPNGNTISAVPDYRVGKRSQLDVQVSQKLFRSSLQLIAGVNNLLQNRIVHYQDLNGNKKFDTPLKTEVRNNGAYYRSGIDNTIVNIAAQPHYYISVSYLIK